MAIIKMFYDLETTGTDVRKHSIHQIAGCIEVDGVVMEYFDIKTAPNPKAQIDLTALEVGKVTEEQIKAYMPMERAKTILTTMLAKYVNKFDRKDKIFLVGFNNSSFDDPFLRAWFEQNGDSFFNSWFWPGSLDTMTLASQYLLERRTNMPNFKLSSVAAELGLEVIEYKLHDGVVDVKLTREVYLIVSGLECEL